MLDLLTNVKYLLKEEEVCIDDGVFRLHYKATAFFLAVCSLIVTSKQYIGDPIDCIFDSSIDQKAVNTYCWIFSTFTITNKQKENEIPRPLEPYPGVGNEHDGAEIVHQKYYQWVCFLLAMQAAMFTLPHFLWRAWEGGKIKMLVADLCAPITDSWTDDRKQQTVEYLSRSNLYNFNLYAFQFLFCEFLNVLNIVVQIFIWDKVLGNRFLTFGPDVIQFTSASDPAPAHDPVSSLFPKMTKCTFHYYGPSGSLQQIDAICVLPLNIVNEKMFVFLWFWFFSLAFMTITAFLYDVFLFGKPRMRAYVLQAQARLVPRAHAATVVSQGSLGLWFLLHQLGRNMNPLVFGDLLAALAPALDKGKPRLRKFRDISTPV